MCGFQISDVACRLVQYRCTCRNVIVEVYFLTAAVADVHVLFVEVAARPLSLLGIEHEGEVESFVDHGRA